MLWRRSRESGGPALLSDALISCKTFQQRAETVLGFLGKKNNYLNLTIYFRYCRFSELSWIYVAMCWCTRTHPMTALVFLGALLIPLSITLILIGVCLSWKSQETVVSFPMVLLKDFYYSEGLALVPTTALFSTPCISPYWTKLHNVL